MAKASSVPEACVRNCAPPAAPARLESALRSSMDAIPTRSNGRWREKSEPISPLGKFVIEMAITVPTTATTREKLELARAAVPRMAQLFTAEKNRLLQAMAAALEAQVPSILEANQRDLDSGGTTGAMHDRLLLTPERVTAMASGVREIAAR